MKKIKAKNGGSFADDCAFLEMTYSWLSARCARIAAEQRIRQANRPGVPSGTRAIGQLPYDIEDEEQRRLGVLRDQEANLKADVDARLERHRATPGPIKLGLDKLTDEHDLHEDERLLLVILTLPALGGQPLVDAVLNDLATGIYCGLTIEQIVVLFDLQRLRQHLRIRRLFGTTSKLVQGGLIVVEYASKVALPEDLHSARCSLTRPAFATLVGDPTINGENGDDHDGPKAIVCSA